MEADSGTWTPAVVDAARLFGMRAPLEEPVLAARGAMGVVYRVVTAGGRYAIKRLFEWNDGSSAEREAAFTARAREAGVTTPVEVRSSVGSLIVVSRDQRFRAFSWLDLHPPLRPPLSVDVLAELGRVVACLHKAGEPTSEIPDDWYVTPPAASTWESLAVQAGADTRPFALTLRRRLPELRAFSGWLSEAPPLPAWTCHRDLDLSNVLPTADGGLAVLDWENLGPLATRQEIAYVVLEWAAPADDDLAIRVRALRDAYATAAGQCPALDLYTFNTAWVTLLNFLVAQASAVLNPDTAADHREFGEKAVENILDMDLSPTAANRVIGAWNS